jgi:hypothetical protein
MLTTGSFSFKTTNMIWFFGCATSKETKGPDYTSESAKVSWARR